MPVLKRLRINVRGRLVRDVPDTPTLAVTVGLLRRGGGIRLAALWKQLRKHAVPALAARDAPALRKRPIVGSPLLLLLIKLRLTHTLFLLELVQAHLPVGRAQRRVTLHLLFCAQNAVILPSAFAHPRVIVILPVLKRLRMNVRGRLVRDAPDTPTYAVAIGTLRSGGPARRIRAGL